jgi:hypothetical protein
VTRIIAPSSGFCRRRSWHYPTSYDQINRVSLAKNFERCASSFRIHDPQTRSGADAKLGRGQPSLTRQGVLGFILAMRYVPVADLILSCFSMGPAPPRLLAYSPTRLLAWNAEAFHAVNPNQHQCLRQVLTKRNRWIYR